MQIPMTRLFRPQVAALIMALAAAGSLAFVYALQFGWGFQPCILCIWQRVPYGLMLLVGVAAVMWRPAGKHTRILLALCALLMLAETGVAIFHTGVERHWWLGTSSCSNRPLGGGSAKDLREQLLNMGVARCDEISWSLFGLSLANYNIIFALMLAGFAATAAIKKEKL